MLGKSQGSLQPSLNRPIANLSSVKTMNTVLYVCFRPLTLSSTMSLPSSSPCPQPTVLPVSVMMWCSSSTSTSDGEISWLRLAVTACGVNFNFNLITSASVWVCLCATLLCCSSWNSAWKESLFVWCVTVCLMCTKRHWPRLQSEVISCIICCCFSRQFNTTVCVILVSFHLLLGSLSDK